jgi:hypothetical protein
VALSYDRFDIIPMKMGISVPAWNKTGPNRLFVLRIKYPSARPNKKVIKTKATAYGVYAIVPLPATVWLNEKINACNILEMTGPNNDSYFLRKSPLYNNSSLIPFDMTMISIPGIQGITLPMLRFWPLNMYVATGMDAIAKIKKAIRPMMMPCLRFPFCRKMVGGLSPEMRDRTIIGMTTSTVLNNMLMAKPLTGVVDVLI